MEVIEWLLKADFMTMWGSNVLFFVVAVGLVLPVTLIVNWLKGE